MRSKSEVSAQKLRGGFYTPESLVQFSLERLRSLLGDRGDLRVVEPSAGDGAFLRGIAENESLSRHTSEIVAVEPLDLEAEKCKRLLGLGAINGTVLVESAVEWGANTRAWFDAAVGNPPFVRYQFLSHRDKAQIARLGEKLDLSFVGVSNLWLPVLVAALSRLMPGGAFSFVVPTELLTGLSASRLRRWVAKNFEQLRLDLFEPGSFPGVLQEVGVFSGRRRGKPSASPTLTIGEHKRSGSSRAWTHEVDPEQPSWTRYLLEPRQLVALRESLSSEAVRPLKTLAKFQVSIVTGANDFFSVSTEDLERFELAPWAKPLLPRIRHAPGLVYTRRDQAATAHSGARSWLLDFSEAAESPLDRPAPARYIHTGEQRGLPDRYKCRIRDPWFRVPHIHKGRLLMSKRSHRHPRVIVNQAGAYTTDTIYRGQPLTESGLSARDLSATFHSSVTLLTAELEGRSFGGGVLELVPSEIERLAIACAEGAEQWLNELDEIARSDCEEELVAATDRLLVRAGVLDPDLVEELREARMALLRRRLARNERLGKAAEPIQLEDLAA